MRIRSVGCAGCVGCVHTRVQVRSIYASGCAYAYAHPTPRLRMDANTRRWVYSIYTAGGCTHPRVRIRGDRCVYASGGCAVRRAYTRVYTYNVAVRSLRRTRWVRVYASTMYTQRVRTHTRVRISRWTVVCRRCTINDEEKSFLIESCLILRDNPVCSRTLWVFCVFRNGFLLQGFPSSYCACIRNHKTHNHIHTSM